MSVNLGYLHLVAAIITGCIANHYLKMSNGFTILKDTVIAIFFCITLAFFLSKTYQTIKFGVGRSLYATSLIIFAFIWGYFAYKEKINYFGIAGVVLIIIGIVCLYIK